MFVLLALVNNNQDIEDQRGLEIRNVNFRTTSESEAILETWVYYRFVC